MATLDNVIVEFATRRAMPPPALDEETGGYALAIGGRHIIHLREQGGAVAACAWLADLPPDDQRREETLRRLLRGELARFAEDDAVLSLDQDAGALQMHRLVDRAALDVDSFEALLQSLVDAVERRRRILGERPRTRPIAPLVIRP